MRAKHWIPNTYGKREKREKNTKRKGKKAEQRGKLKENHQGGGRFNIY